MVTEVTFFLTKSGPYTYSQFRRKAHYWFLDRLIFLSRALCYLRPFLCRLGYGGNEDLINACWNGHIIMTRFLATPVWHWATWD
jgi:hypothetical protein